MTTESTELAPPKKPTSMQAALRAQRGASEPAQPEPQQAPTPQVDEVADAAPAEVAKTEPEQVAREETNGKAKLPDLSNVPGFNEWQSSMDKQLSQLRKERDEAQAAKAKAAEPTGPSPELVNKRQSLLDQYTLASQQAESAISTDDIVSWRVAANRMAEQIAEIDYHISAEKYGLDPADKELRDWYDAMMKSGEIETQADMDNALLRKAWNTRTMPELSQTLSEREKAITAREAELDARIKEEVDKQVALVLQQSGMSNIPAMKPQGQRSQRQELEAQKQVAWETGNMREALRIDRLISSLES